MKPVNVIIDRHLCDEVISHLPVCLPVIRVFFLAFKERQANLAATNPSYNGNDVVSWNFSFLLKLNEARVFVVRSIFSPITSLLRTPFSAHIRGSFKTLS